MSLGQTEALRRQYPEEDSDREVVILGAGIVGICCALSLAARGVQIRLIDRDPPGQGASYGNAGVISPWSVIPQSVPGLWKTIPGLMFGQFRPLSVPLWYSPRMLHWGMRFLMQGTETKVRHAARAMELLCAPSIDLYRRHLQGTGAEGLIRDSIYIHAFRDESRATLSGLGYRIRQEKGAELELVGADQLHRLEPDLSPEFRAAVLIKGQARAYSPGRVAAVLASKAQQMGVRIERQNVTALTRSKGAWIIHGDDGQWAAGRVVVALGAWSASLLKPLGMSLPLVAERGYHVEFSDPGIEVHNSVMDVDAKCVASSMEGGIRVTGFAEFNRVNAPPNPGREMRLVRHAKAIFPALRQDPVKLWMGQRPSFPDSLPMIGEFERHPGLFAAFGHSHYGFMMAPKTGELIADLIGKRPGNESLSSFGTDR